MPRTAQRIQLIPTEWQECKAFWDWAQFVPILRDYLIKIANEGKRSVCYGYSVKAIGCRAGIPDYFLPICNDSWMGLWIEMKRRDQVNMALRDNQHEWQKKLLGIQHYATFAYGFDQAVSVTEDYLANRI